MKIRLLPNTAAFIVSVTLGGCAVAPPPEDPDLKIAGQLESINRSLEEIIARQKAVPLPPFQSAQQPQGADRAKLAAIKSLSAQPTPEEITAYLKAISAASQGQKSYSSSDPQIEMIRQVGRGHLEKLAPFLSSWHFRQALPALLTPEDQAEILRLLPRYPQLIAMLIYTGYDQEQLDTVLLAAICQPNPPVFPFETCRYLKNLLEAPISRAKVFEATAAQPALAAIWMHLISQAKDPERLQLVRKTWEIQSKRPDATAESRAALAQRAAVYGLQEALDVQVDFYLKQEKPSSQQRYFLEQRLPQTKGFSKEQLKTWYDAHRLELRYDPSKRDYKLPTNTKTKQENNHE